MLGRVLGFLYRIILSRNISPALLGSYTVALSIACVFTTLLCSGIPLVISKQVASNEVEKKYKHSYGMVFSGLIVSLIISLLLVALTLLFPNIFDSIFTSHDSYVMIVSLLPYIVSTAVYTSIRGYLWGKEKYYQVSMVEFVEQICKIVLCIVLFKVMKNGYIYAPGIIISVSCILSTILGFYYFKKEKGQIRPYPSTMKTLLHSSTPLTTIKTIGSLINPFVSIILPLMLIKGGYSSEQALALLGISMGMVLPLISIPSTIIGSLSMALIPQLNTLKSEKNYEKLISQIKSSFVFTIFATFLLVPIFSSISVPICKLIFDNASAGKILNIFAWIMVPNGLMMISSSILNSLGYEKFTFVSYTISSVFLIVGIFVLPQYLGINALFVSLGLNGICVFLLNYFKIKKETGLDNIVLIKLAVLAFITIPMTLFNKFLYNILALIFPSFVAIALICIISVVIFTTLMFAFGIINIEYFNTLKTGLKNKVRVFRRKSRKNQNKNIIN